jgi:hypothetical protein
MTPLKWLLSLGILFLLVIGGAKFVEPMPAPSSVAQVAGESVAQPAAVKILVDDGKRIQAFYELESKRIGAVDPNPGETKNRLEVMARDLTPGEILWLEAEAVNPKVSGDGRFFATYLLALSLKPEAMAALGNLAISPVPDSKNKGRVELERQIRAQAIEGLGRAKARDPLLDVVEKQSDEFLRDRAHRALHEVSGGKTVEEQDREGLTKLLYKK